MWSGLFWDMCFFYCMIRRREIWFGKCVLFVGKRENFFWDNYCLIRCGEVEGGWLFFWLRLGLVGVCV